MSKKSSKWDKTKHLKLQRLKDLNRVASITSDDGEELNRDKSLRKAFLTSVEQFALETSMHGMKFIAKKHFEQTDKKSAVRVKSFIGNFLWIGATLFGACFSVYMMQLVWDRFVTTPTVTTVETINNPISQVPFPAVTVCNINKVHYPNTERIRNILKANSIEDENIMSYLGNLSRLVTMDSVDEQNVRVEYLLERLGYTTDTLMREFVLDCSEMLSNCSWLGEDLPCTQLFRMVKGSEGFCCSFNYRGLRQEYNVNYDNFNQSLLNDSSTDFVSGAGEYVGLIFMVDTQPHNYVSPTESYYGAEVIVHNTFDYPDLTTSTSVVQPGEDLRLAIEPEMIVSQEGIRKMDILQRDCLFEDELELTLTPKYSFESCMTECRADHNMEMCHCLQFIFPMHRPKSEDGYVRQCAMRDLFCLRNIRHLLFSLEKENKQEGENKTGMDCECLPSCSTVLYRLDSNVGEMIPEHGQQENASIVYVFFKDLTSLKYRRDPFMNWDGLFAAFGGIFGLCLGGSIISFVELTYFLTFKFYTLYRKFKHEFQMNFLRNLLDQKTSCPVYNVYDNRFVGNKNNKDDDNFGVADKTIVNGRGTGRFLW